MKIKLLINGEDHRVVMYPESGVDQKLLNFVSEYDIADVRMTRELYTRDIEKVELKLKNKPLENDPN